MHDVCRVCIGVRLLLFIEEPLMKSEKAGSTVQPQAIDSEVTQPFLARARAAMSPTPSRTMLGR